MGSNINTAEWDAYYSISADGSKAFFTSSDENSIGARDIYSISLENELKPEPVMLVRGKVFNSETNEPIMADIVFETYFEGVKEGMASPDTKTMEYKAILSRGNKYRILAYAEGFMPLDIGIDVLAFDAYSELHKDIYLDPIALGDLITFNNILFNKSTPELLPESDTELAMLETLLKENPNMVIELAGHTDSWGDVSKNFRLSQERVEVVKNYLTMRGIDARRLQAKGYGGSQPVASNATEESRQLNRRVEVKVLKN
jgi:outer membrane protein OmpA-like peptidoglycan-associated protein